MHQNKVIPSINRSLFWLLGLGLLFKLTYLFVIGPKLFGDQLCISNDTYSYTYSFINLVTTGKYTHNPDYEPASYGRLPAVGFSWGVFYLIFGLANSYKAFACFQIFLDLLASVFIYRIVRKFFNDRTAFIASAAYTFFPLITFFVVKTGVEFLTIFFTIAVFYSLVFYQPTVKKSILLGFFAIVGLFVKETLLMLIPFAFVYLYRNTKPQLKYYMIVAATILFIYLPWPIRNYAHMGSLMLTKPVSAGYIGFKDDIMNYVYWMYSWHNCDMLHYFNNAYDDSKPIDYPKEIFNSPSEEKLAHDLIMLGRTCGTSFAWWKKMKSLPPQKVKCNYDKLIGRGFDVLRNNYIKTHPFVFFIKIPIENLGKAFFKNSLTNSGSKVDGIFAIMMIFRSVFLLTGILACLLYWENDYFKMSFIYFWVMYIFICGVFRQVEMRYVLPADVVMLVASCCLIGKYLPEKNSKARSVQ